MSKITAYEIINHGVEHSQYFQGCSTAFTAFNDVSTGIGSSAYEACQDALEQLYMIGYITNDELEAETNELSRNIPAEVFEQSEDNELHVFVSIRVKGSTV